ncbi:MAG TPA: phosphoenolpyruvate synthase [Caldilineae bacterium]|nr:phosphoenolpyruvate synthase [Caldilineae bacterium]
MAFLVLPFNAISAADLPRVGGKGANLGELTRAGFNVPPGFCVTTGAFRLFMAKATQDMDIYAALESITPDDIERLRQVGREVREHLQRIPLPQDIADAVVAAWREVGEEHTYAVRSSATAEDLPYASFAGQHDTYLNVRGEEALLDRVKACFISLFTDRAILYRIQNGFDHRQVALAVVVQRMVQPDVSGIIFTADPISGNRNVVSIDASFGLGEALVSGLVSADLYKVHKKTFHIVTRHIGSKEVAIRPLAEGGTEQVELPEAERGRPALTDEQVIALARLGVQIEAHFVRPQDIEWALENGTFYILQSRPITSLASFRGAAHRSKAD